MNGRCARVVFLVSCFTDDLLVGICAEGKEGGMPMGDIL
jgi:hypothetical protein